MDYMRRAVFGPNLDEQRRECKRIITKNNREIDKQIRQTEAGVSTARSKIQEAVKRGQRHPHMKSQADKDTRILAREIAKARKSSARLHTSKAQLGSISMRTEQAFTMAKIEKSYKDTTGVMKEVNTMMRMPELSGVMRNLGEELMKSDVFEEMAGDMLPDDSIEEVEGEPEEEEITNILNEVIGTPKLPDAKVNDTIVTEPEPQQEETLEAMKGRLEALRS